MIALNGRMGLPRILIAAGTAFLAGCATQTPVGLHGASDLPLLAQSVAAQLERAALDDPARLAVVELELRRISDALPGGGVAAASAGRAAAQTSDLMAPDAASAAAPGAAGVWPGPQAGTEGAAAQTADAATAESGPYAAPPQLSGARSLFSALTLGAYPNADTARAAWFGMNAAHGEALAGLDARLETQTREGGGANFLLKAGPFATAQEAETLCARLRQAGAVCAPGDFTGEPL